MDTVISFNDLPVLEIVQNQFNDSGITFKNANHFSSGMPFIKEAEDGNKILSIRNCSGEFCTSAVTCSFRLPHKKVLFLIRNLKDAAANVILYVYDGAMNLLDTIKTQVTRFDGLSMPVEILRDNADIGNVIVLSPAFTADLAIDAIIYDEGDSSPVPTFSISRQEPYFPVGLRPLMAAEDKISITRSWGSTGNIIFEIENLPRGVTATFSPNPNDGNMVILKLSASYEAEPCVGKRAIVKAIPSSSLAGPEIKTLEIPITVAANFSLLPLDIDIPSCTDVYSDLIVYIPRSGFDNPEPGFIPHSFRGKVELTLFSFGGSPLPEGVELSFTPDEIIFGDKVVVKSVIRVKARPGSLTKKIQVAVLATNPDYPTNYTFINLNPVAGQLENFTPNRGNTPVSLRPGSEIVLEGTGLCNFTPPLKVQFGNHYAEAVVASADGRRATITVPRLATDGPLTLVSEMGTSQTAGAFKVVSFRNTNGFAFRNFHMNSASFEDLTEAFGKSQTYISATIDPCRDATFGALNCPIVQISTVPNPLSLIILGIINSNLSGHCFGMSITCERLLKKEVPYSLFSPFTAENAFQLSDAGGPWARLGHHLRIQSLIQFSSEVSRYWLANASNIWATSDSYKAEIPMIKTTIIADLIKGNYPLIMMRKGGKGHVVLAYDVEEGDGNSIAFYIWVYDSNLPFTNYDDGEKIKNENTNADEHLRREKTNGRIIIYTDGRWEYTGDFNPKWGPYYFHSREGSLVVAPYEIIPRNPSLPLSPEGIITFVFGAASTVQMSDKENKTLFNEDGTVNTDPGTRLEGVAPFAFSNGNSNLSDAYIMKPGTYFQKLRGSENGSYSGAIVGNDFALRLDDIATNNSTDEISFDPAAASFSFKSEDEAKPLNATLITGAKDKSVRTILLNTHILKNKTARVEFSADRQKLIYRNEGNKTAFSLTIGWAGTSGVPGAFTSDLLDIASDETFIFSPDWESLNESEVNLEIVSKNGKVKKQRLVNMAKYPVGLQIDRLDIQDTNEAEKSLKIDVIHSQVELISSVIVMWLVTKGQRLAGRYIQNINGKDLKEGIQSYDWNFYPEEPGEYRVTATVVVISNTLPPFSLKRTESKAFEVIKTGKNVIISQILADPKGPDIENEYVVIKNISKDDIDISGWSIRDMARHRYRIPTMIITVGSEVKIWTKSGVNDRSNLYMGRKKAIWTNKGDIAILNNDKDSEIARLSYHL